MDKIKKRIDFVINTISELNVLDQNGTSYPGSGVGLMDRKRIEPYKQINIILIK